MTEGDTDLLMREADRLLGSEQYEDALQIYERVLAIDSRNASAWHHRGYALRRLGRFEEALESFDREMELDPVNTEAVHSNRGYSLQALGRYREAIDAFDEVLRINPNHVKALTSRGLCLAALGRHNEALPCYDRALQPNMLNAFVWHAKSQALAAQRMEGVTGGMAGMNLGDLLKYEAPNLYSRDRVTVACRGAVWRLCGPGPVRHVGPRAFLESVWGRRCDGRSWGRG